MKNYNETFWTLDTETSFIKDGDNCKAWVYSYAMYNGRNYIACRNMDVFLQLQHKLLYNPPLITVCYVHNLSYDITYLLKWLLTVYKTQTSLCIDAHKYLTVTFDDCVEFRCSWKLSNMSLLNWCRKLNTPHQKLDGYLDYSLVIYPDTHLTAKQRSYIKNDVIAQYECIVKDFELNEVNISNAPITSTGYIRQYARREFKRSNTNRKLFLKSKLNEHVYNLIMLAFHGGYTHGNRYLAGRQLQDVEHYDFESHYPAIMLLEPFPIGEFTRYATYDDDVRISHLLPMISDYCMLIVIDLSNVTVKRGVTMPMLQSYKCKTSVYRSARFGLIDDNGRVLKFYRDARCRITLTELELQELHRQYTFDYRIVEVYMSRKGMLPEWLRDVVKHFYKEKTLYKRESKRCQKEFGDFDERTVFSKQMLMKSKNRLNGIAGMCETNPIRDDIDYDLEQWHKIRYHNKDIHAELERYYKSRNSFMSLQYGCWITAYGQFKLLQMAELIGYDNVIYGDTDSLFFRADSGTCHQIELYNNGVVKRCEVTSAYVIIDGEKQYIGRFLSEEEDIMNYKFLHSKCYGYTNNRGLHLTIAGVSASALLPDGTRLTREEELGQLSNLKIGAKFKINGKKKASYLYDAPHIEDIDGHLVPISDAVIIEPSEYKIKDIRYEYDVEYEAEFLPE